LADGRIDFGDVYYEARARIDGASQFDPEFEIQCEAFGGRLRSIGIEAETVGGEKRVY
jgi:hypothetical protein